MMNGAITCGTPAYAAVPVAPPWGITAAIFGNGQSCGMEAMAMMPSGNPIGRMPPHPALMTARHGFMPLAARAFARAPAQLTDAARGRGQLRGAGGCVSSPDIA